MTKNDAQAKQTVRIYSADGEEIGTTYPKRARGLVKKGRAQFVNDCDIRLIVPDVSKNTEETTMMDNNNTNNIPAQAEPVNKLYFDAREWILNKECKNNVGNRSFMQGPDGVINEAFMIGDWSWNWTEIISRVMILPKNTLNTFTFWLNGGENDNNNEICRFEIIFNNDYENRYTYNLNRNFIKPLKKCNGWELYEIPFRTGDNEYTQFKFVAQRAYMTVLNAKDVSEYAELPDTADPYEQYRPQRHNIVFNDGWPNNTWYSTAKLEAAHGSGNSTPEVNSAPNGSVPPAGFPFEVPQGFPFNNMGAQGDNSGADAIGQSIVGINASIESLRNFDFDGLRESLKSSLASNPNLTAEEVEELIQDSMESAEDSISDAIDELNDALEELNDALEEMQD
ncbi:MAG: hypothetical protein IJZ95_02165 [Oscillospiraceae bacterium]|nr:hypothetical protein [Oscillospiraceae bacterium]